MNKIDSLKKYIVKDVLKLDCGKEISNFPIAYETYGILNKEKTNGILIDNIKKNLGSSFLNFKKNLDNYKDILNRNNDIEDLEQLMERMGYQISSKFEKNFKRTMRYQFINAFPKSMASVPVSYGPADILKVTVSFNYDRYIVRG